ncbi:hypothetical protein Mapa_007837 [Marchantia paleacea]|nr:hypothetical protein Mapa_007837 [Marchantia paleacea]
MYAEVLECQLEIRNVRFHLHIEELPGYERCEKQNLLREWKHQRPQSCDVGFECVSGNSHELPGQGHAEATCRILLLVNAAEALVIGALVGPHGVQELVFGPTPLAPLVREQHCGSPHSENAVGHELTAIISEVPIEGDILRAHHDGVGIAMDLEKVTGQVYRYQTRAAPHSAQVQRLDVPSHVVVIYDHRRH